MRIIFAVIFALVLCCCQPALAQYDPSYCGTQILYFQHQNSPDIPGYEELVNTPSGNAEVDENITITSASGPTLIDTYIMPAGVLYRTIALLKGLRTFTTYHYVSVASGVTQVNFTAFQRFANGTEVVFYSQLSDDIDALTITPYTTYRVSQTDLLLNPTDRLGIKLYGQTTHPAPVTLHFVYQGSVHTSHFMSGSFLCSDQPIHAQAYPETPVPIAIPLFGIVGAIGIAVFKYGGKK